MPASPFTSVSVQPSYGDRRVLVTWRVLPGYGGSRFFVYRSMTGTAPWEMLNEVSGGKAIPALGTSFEDDEFVVENRVTDTHYRLLMVEEAGTEHESPVVSMFGNLTRKQWGGACKIMHDEHLRMCVGNGVPVLHYIPLVGGEDNPMFDPDTGQQLGPECPDTPASESGYGLGSTGGEYGGFGPPTRTFVELQQLGPVTMQDDPGGRGTDDTYKVRARMLAHPRPNRGHMLVHTPSDNRYAVGETLQGYYFRGLVALAYHVELTLLRRDDPRYRVPVPPELLVAT